MFNRKFLIPLVFVGYLSGLFGGYAVAAAQDVTPEVTPVVTVTPAPEQSPVIVQQPSDLSQLLDRALNLVLVVIIAFLAYRQGALTSPETLDKIFGFLRSVTASTTNPDDDKLLGIIEEVVRRVAAEVKPTVSIKADAITAVSTEQAAKE